MVRIEFVERLHFVTAEKVEILSSTSFPAHQTELIENYVRTVIQPTDSAFDEIIDKIGRLTINKGFFLGGCKYCKYIILTNHV